ncbi:MAG: ABC transporter substrate-binding protein [Hyphomicrobiales bacterium]|nr:ABC transporter substrate-binding protein [Hyphomicrobiales bacterium]
MQQLKPCNLIGRRIATAISAVALLTLGLTDTGRSQPASDTPYTLGVTYPLSGPFGAWGQLLVPAIQIAADHINAAGGVNGHPLKLVVEDTKGNPEGAVSAMRKVVQVDQVPMILTIFTNVVSAQIPLTAQFKVSLISPVEAPGLVAKSPWAFAHSPLLTSTLPLLAEHWNNTKVKRLFAFFPNTPLAKYASATTKAEIAKLGIEYEETLFKLGETDFRGLITRAKSFNPDAILVYGHGTPDEGVIMKQIRELGMDTPMFNSCACVTVKGYREAAGKAAEGVIFSGFKYDRNSAKKLVDSYRAKLGFDPDYAALEVYDMVFMIAEAINKYGYDGEGIRKGLSEIKDFRSIGGGLVSMDKDGQTVVPVALYRLTEVTKPEFVEIQP